MGSHWWHRWVKTLSPVTDSFAWGDISDSLSGHFIWKYELTLEFTLASQRSFLQKTNECFNCMNMVCCKLMRIGNNYDRKQVSAISSPSKITTSGKNFTFCSFWLKKMHWNCLSCMYLGLMACQIQWHLFWVSTLSGSWKITILGDTL